MTDEQRVREVWQAVSTWWDREYDEEWITAKFGPAYADKVILFKGRATPAEAWAAARAFTEERLEQIRQLENEVATMSDLCQFTRSLLNIAADQVEIVRDLCCNSRILAARQAALTELKRGLRMDRLTKQGDENDMD